MIEILRKMANRKTFMRGEPVPLSELPPGMMFEYEGCLALKTEYRTEKGAIEAYIVGSGEFFWGGTTNAEDQADLVVTPVEI